MKLDAMIESFFRIGEGGVPWGLILMVVLIGMLVWVAKELM